MDRTTRIFPLDSVTTSNPVHVYFHYIMRDDKEKNGNSDLSLTVFSLMDPTKHVNSMPIPGTSVAGATPVMDVDDDVPSSNNQYPLCHALMKRLSRTLDRVMKEFQSPIKTKHERGESIVDMIVEKVLVKKLRLKLKKLNEEDTDDDYDRDSDLLTQELKTINQKLNESLKVILNPKLYTLHPKPYTHPKP